MNDFDPQSPRDYTPRFSWWWLVMGVVVLGAMFLDRVRHAKDDLNGGEQ